MTVLSCIVLQWITITFILEMAIWLAINKFNFKYGGNEFFITFAYIIFTICCLGCLFDAIIMGVTGNLC